MNCRIVDLREKQVVCIKDGTIIGFVCDVEIDMCSGKICALVVFGKLKCFGLFGRSDDYIVPWDRIEVMGRDTVLVNCEPPRSKKHCRTRPFGRKDNRCDI